LRQNTPLKVKLTTLGKFLAVFHAPVKKAVIHSKGVTAIDDKIFGSTFCVHRY
jgi:hypothetical protein